MNTAVFSAGESLLASSLSSFSHDVKELHVQTDRQTDRQTDTLNPCWRRLCLALVTTSKSCTCRHADSKQTDRKTDRQTLTNAAVFSAGESLLASSLSSFSHSAKGPHVHLGKAHLREAILLHEDALRLHSLCKLTRKIDTLQVRKQEGFLKPRF